jgi:hypothetical protein
VLSSGLTPKRALSCAAHENPLENRAVYEQKEEGHPDPESESEKRQR